MFQIKSQFNTTIIPATRHRKVIGKDIILMNKEPKQKYQIN